MSENSSTQRLKDTIRLVPHSKLRDYQDIFLNKVERHPRTMIDAPTGFGKTSMSLIATLPYVKNQKAQILIFVRTKAQIFEAFLPQLNKVANTGDYGYISAFPLILKEQLCIEPIQQIKGPFRGFCTGTKCTQYKKTKDYLSDPDTILTATENVRINQQVSGLEEYKELLKQFGCPYHVIRKCIPYADCVVTTHAYLRSNFLREHILSSLLDQNTKSKIAIIDEAHNFNQTEETELTQADIIFAKKVMNLDVFNQLERLLGQNKRIPIYDFSEGEIIIDDFLNRTIGLDMGDRLAIQRVRDFLSARGDIWVSLENKLLQLNPFPSKIFKFCSANFARIILMSGTFSPIDLYKRLYNVNYTVIQIPKDFTYSKEAILRDGRFTTKYSNRNANTYRLLAELIIDLHDINPFHTIVFAPSYSILQNNEGIDLYSAIRKITDRRDDISTPIVEPRYSGSMTEILQELRTCNPPHELILGVIGGKFSEGIEILSDRFNPPRSLLTQVLVAGIPHPPPSHVDTIQGVLEQLYIRKYGPRLTRLLLQQLHIHRGINQALGRAIRHSKDFAGKIILDYRAIHSRVLRNPRVFTNPKKMVAHFQNFYVKMCKHFGIEYKG